MAPPRVPMRPQAGSAARGGPPRVACPAVDARSIARLHALGRLALGAGLALAPGRVAGGWVGGVADRPRGPGARRRPRRARRGARARDPRALRRGRGAADWIRAGMLADAADLVATLRARDSLPPLAAPAVAALAGGSVAARRLAAGRRRLTRSARAVEHARPDRVQRARRRPRGRRSARGRVTASGSARSSRRAPWRSRARRAAGCGRPRSPARCAPRSRRRSSARAAPYASSTSGSSAAASASARSTGPCSANTATMPSVAARASAGPSPSPVNQRSAIVNSSPPMCSTTRSTRWWRSRK